MGSRGLTLSQSLQGVLYPCLKLSIAVVVLSPLYRRGRGRKAGWLQQWGASGQVSSPAQPPPPQLPVGGGVSGGIRASLADPRLPGSGGASESPPWL